MSPNVKQGPEKKVSHEDAKDTKEKQHNCA